MDLPVSIHECHRHSCCSPPAEVGVISHLIAAIYTEIHYGNVPALSYMHARNLCLQAPHKWYMEFSQCL